MMPQVEDFLPIFWFLIALKAICGVLVGLWAQRPGLFAHDEEAPRWDRTVLDLKRLFVNVRFWALVIALCLLGGPIFQATNLYLPSRAEDLGLIQGAADHGWVWLKLLGTMMWIPGGLAVGLLAGRRAPGIAAVAMLGCFALTALGIGVSSLVWQLFLFVAMFEVVRQFMRWSHAGYMSEHMPQDLRATAIGCSITISGLGSVIFVWIAGYIWDADLASFQSTRPFQAAAVLGLIGCVGLFIFDRFCPIRQPLGEDTPAVEPDATLEEGSVNGS